LKRALTILLLIALTAALLVYALWDVDFTELARLLADASYGYAIPFLLALTIYYFLKAWRWRMIMAPLGRYSIGQVTPAMMIGFAANNVLPAHLGELIRTVLFARRYQQPMSGVFTSQVLERILDVVAIVALFLLAVPWIDAAPEAIRVSVWLVSGATLAVAVLIATLLAAPEAVFKLWHALSAKLPASIQRRGASVLESVLHALSSVRSPARLLVLILNSVVQWSFMALGIWLSMGAFGVWIDAGVVIVVLTTVVVAVTIPSAPGYVGAIQAAFVFALSPFGVDAASAFAGSVFFLVVHWIPVTALGALLAMKMGLGVSELRRAADEGDAAQAPQQAP
jgi:uncharacterized protein (TIRG00374 family)